MKLDKNPKRLLIFFFYDKAGVVDAYIPYLLDDLKKNVTEIEIVVNGALNEEGRKTFLSYTDRLVVRENKGFDVWAYKTGMEQFGWDGLCAFDEIILMNFTMMGPVYPFAEMFDEMAERDLDFWGITQFYRADFDPFGTMPEGYVPDHIQSHFIAVRRSMFTSESFHDYWDHMPMITGYLDSISNHEAKFTKYFESKGFSWAVYCDAEDFRTLSYQPAVGMAKRMVDEKRCPMFKRRSFMQDYDVILNESCGQEAFELYRYLDEKTAFDMDLLWDNLLRVENQADLKKNLQWNYVLPSDYAEEEAVAEGKRIALCMHIHFADLIRDCARYAASMPPGTDFYITTNTEEKKREIEAVFGKLPTGKLDCRVVPNRGRDVGPFLVEFREHLLDYDLICHAHDKKAGQVRPGSVGLSFAYKCFENVLASPAYVKNVLRVFEKNPRAGLLTPPPPFHADYYFTLGLEWGMNFEATKKLAEELGSHCSIREDREPVAPLGSYFWARAEALKPLFSRKWTYEDFPEEPVADDGTILHAIERIYPFSAQAAGFYPGWILSEHGAAMEITNMNHMLHRLNQIIFFEGQDAGSYVEVLHRLSNAYKRANRAAGRSFYEKGVAKLYLAKEGADYSEETALSPELSVAGETCTYTFPMNGEDWITALRFDPCEEGGITLQGFVLTVRDFGDRIFTYKVEDLYHNAVALPDRLVFLTGDPMLEVRLKRKLRIREVTVSCSVKTAATEELTEVSNLANRKKR